MQPTTETVGKRQASPPAVAVIIPYFQRKPGILARALESVYGQDYTQPFDLLIVDDESPVPAQDELTAAPAPAHVRVSVLAQKNGGPGAARNAGLDEACRRGIDIVAFLDSDDRWTPDHLRRGVEAIGHGFDIYAANWSLLGESDEQADAHSARDLRPEHLAAFDSLADADQLVCPLLDQQLRASVLKMSSLIYALGRFPGLRFQAKLRSASEDKLFGYEMALAEPKLLLSRRMEVFAGTGVNVFASATWGSAQSYPVFRDQLAGTRYALVLLKSRPDALMAIRRRRRDIMKSVIQHSLHMLAHRRSFSVRVLGQIIVAEPMILALTPMVLWQSIVSKLK